jgi:aryl-alcohol dehydrogenase-like predicted oxidoreductase
MHTLGSTGLEVGSLGLGLAALGRPGYVNLGHGDDLPASHDVVAMRDHTHAVLDAAHRAGVRYFDAARSYGRAEEFLAGWLSQRGLERGDLVVGSKWGYTYTADWRVDAERHEVKDHSSATFARQWDETDALLGPWLDLYQVHSATLDSGILDDDGVLDALAALRERGVAVGFTTSGVDQADIIRQASRIERDGRPLFQTVQSTWNLFERSAEAALAEAHQAGLGVIVKEAVANGRLTDRGAERDPSLRAVLARADIGAPLDQVALAAAQSRPWADVVLSGAATVDQVESNIAALELVDSIELEAFDALVGPPDRYWAERRALRWT